MNSIENHVPNEKQKELLELAAKAAAVKCKWASTHGFMSYETQQVWNPLVNDADAMSIASRLNMSLSLDHNGARVWVGESTADGAGIAEPYAALRMAIVRLAAQFGANR